MNCVAAMAMICAVHCRKIETAAASALRRSLRRVFMDRPARAGASLQRWRPTMLNKIIIAATVAIILGTAG
jgi:hypothetical protein